MAGARAILVLAAVVILAGGIVMQFLVILSGLDRTPLNQVYFLEASTSGIQGTTDTTFNPTRWAFLAICGEQDGRNAMCGSTGAAIPFDPPRNFGTEMNVPDQFIGTRHYYYLSRVAWAFYIIAAFFAVVAFFVSIVAYFGRLGAYLTGLTAFLALIFQALCSSLMTAWTVQARNAWQSNGYDSRLGLYAYGFSWGAVGAFLVASVLFCVGGSVGKGKNTEKKGYFGRKRSTRSRGSFIDTSSDRRVKDEYE